MIQAQEVQSYYIASDPVVWNYTPEGMNMITGDAFSEEEAFFTERGDYDIGTEYKKAIYREYTDDTFSELKPRSEDWQHHGFMGPLIRAEVGDTIRIVFDLCRAKSDRSSSYRTTVSFCVSVAPPVISRATYMPVGRFEASNVT